MAFMGDRNKQVTKLVRLVVPWGNILATKINLDCVSAQWE